MQCATMPPINPGNTIAYRLALYHSHHENITKINHLPRIYNLTEIDNLTRIVTGVCTKGNVTIDNRNKRFTIIVVCTSNTGIYRVEAIVATTLQ